MTGATGRYRVDEGQEKAKREGGGHTLGIIGREDSSERRMMGERECKKE